MNAHEAEEMADTMFWNSALPDAGRSDERLPEGGGSDKLPEEGDDEKLLKEGDGEKRPVEPPTGKLMMPCTDRVLPFFLSFGFVTYFSSRFPKSREYCGES